MRDIKTILQVLFVLLFIGTDEVGAQNKSEQTPGWLLQGIITDVHGEPLVGATVRELRTSKGTVSDLDGKFSMLVHKGQTLLFDYVGMKQKSILVGEDRFIKVELESSDNSLEEVVVTGYNQVNSRIFVGAAAKISTKDFAFLHRQIFLVCWKAGRRD